MSATAITFSRKRFTPAEAQALLANTAEAGFTNRSISKVTVARYTHDMMEDNFHSDTTGETIKLGKVKGKTVCLDGQHRLLAQIAYGKPMWFLVCEDIPVEMFKFIDGGKPRTLADLMTISGSPLATHAKEYAVTGYMLYKEDHTDDPRRKPDADATDGTGTQFDFVKAEYADELSGLMAEHIEALRAAARNGMGAASLWLYFAIRMNKRDPKLLAKLLHYVANYGGVKPCSKNFQFAAKMVENLRKEHKDPDGTVKKARYKDFLDGVMDVWALAWNLTREGTHLKAQKSFTAKYNSQHKGQWPGIK